MDERFELRLRGGLTELIEPVGGGYPYWESSPAAAQVGRLHREDRRFGAGNRAGRLTWTGAGRVRRVAWVLVAAALLAVLMAVLGIAGSRRETTRPAPLPAIVDPARPQSEAAVIVRHPQPLAPTGIELLSPDHGDYGAAVLDADGETIWLLSDRGLAAFDPSTGVARTWTAADDQAFPRTRSTAIARAASGGVWLIGDALRLFDGGTGFRDVVAAPGTVSAAAEGPDGTMWAASADGSLHHWDGGAWTSVDDPWSTTDWPPSVMVVDTAGHVWLGGYGRGLRRFDGTAWQTWSGADADPLSAPTLSITPLVDGSVLVATGGGVARFDGSAWSILVSRTSGLGSTSSVGVGPDGTLWVAAANSWTGAVSAGHRGEDDAWTTWGPDDGLPDSQGWLTVTILPTHDAVYLAAGGGLFRLDVGRWNRAWPRTIATGPTWVTSLLPMSRDEAWATDDQGWWHLSGGTWTLERPTPAGLEQGGAELRLVDGTPWAATAEGVLRLDADGWRVVDQRPASMLAAHPDGSIWIGAGLGSASPLRILRRVDGTWEPHHVPAPRDMKAITTLAVGPDGTVWAGENVWGIGGVARFDGTSWVSERPLGPGDGDQAASDIVVTPDGDVWAAVNDVIARHDGSGWRTSSAGEGAVPEPFRHSLAVGPDGVAWGASAAGPVRFDGTQWVAVGPTVELDQIWIAPDGSVWGALPDSIARLRDE